MSDQRNCCTVYVDDDGCLEGGSVRTQRARKEHKCGECGDTIKPGRLYEVACGSVWGHWETHKTCARCCNVRDQYFRRGWIYGRIAEHFHDCFGFDYRKGIPDDFAPCRGAKKPAAPVELEATGGG